MHKIFLINSVKRIEEILICRRYLVIPTYIGGIIRGYKSKRRPVKTRLDR